ncbi:MAG: family 20 glycosylhydrolase, partial [Muribaculaceae bacterium]|nr:family 20 glycosylhydrolase [Muribaculaceae bacterium]
MIDPVRCFYTPEELRKMIDMASRLKINNVHLHLTDDNGWRLEIKKYPKLTEVGAWRVDRPDLFPGRMNARSADEKATYGGYYTQKQMRDLVKYAAERNINIVPEIEMPAHAAAAIASYPDLACSVVDKFVGVFPGIGGYDASIILCAGKESTYQFLTDVLDEVMDIFPSKYIHLGGDEANKAVWEKCPDCAARIEHEHLDGYEGLQAYLMDRINHYVRSKGRTAMGWDEVTYGDPKEDMIIYGWQGDGGVAVRDSRRSGRKFIMTPAKTLYLIRYQGPQWFEPFTYFGNNDLHDVYTYEPTGADWDEQLRSNLLGVQGSLWSEFCRTGDDMEYLVFPRLVAVADMGWRPEGRADWNAFLPALDNFTKTLDRNDINYARSMYNLSHVVRPADGKLEVTLSCIRPDVEVRYAADSTFANAKTYTEPITVETPTTVYASTFRDGKQMGRTLALKLDFDKATGHKVIAPTCRNGLAYTLTNGLRGSDRNSDFEWAGWWNETAEFTVDLGKLQPVSSLHLGTLVHSDICVAAPRHVYVYTSPNETSFTLAGEITLDDDIVFHKKARVLDLDLPIKPTEARFIKIVAVNPGRIPDGYPREGSATWMYFDELIVN